MRRRQGRRAGPRTGPKTGEGRCVQAVRNKVSAAASEQLKTSVAGTAAWLPYRCVPDTVVPTLRVLRRGRCRAAYAAMLARHPRPAAYLVATAAHGERRSRACWHLVAGARATCSGSGRAWGARPDKHGARACEGVPAGPRPHESSRTQRTGGLTSCRQGARPRSHKRRRYGTRDSPDTGPPLRQGAGSSRHARAAAADSSPAQQRLPVTRPGVATRGCQSRGIIQDVSPSRLEQGVRHHACAAELRLRPACARV